MLSNFSNMSEINGFALLHLIGYMFHYLPAFGVVAPFKTHPLLLWRQLELLLGLGLCLDGALMLLIFRLGSISPLRGGSFALLPLAISAVCSVVGVTVSTPFLLLYQSALAA